MQQLQNEHGAKVNRLDEFSKKTKLLFALFSLKKKQYMITIRLVYKQIEKG